MAGRGRPTVDPEKIVNVDDWLKYYKLRYGNVVMQAGKLLVLDPVGSRSDPKAALKSPVKTIALKKGHDLVKLVSGESELRAAAEERWNTLDEARKTDAAIRLAEFTALEAQYLQAVDAWVGAGADGRIVAAMEVGARSRELAAADEAYRTALYPHRYIYTNDIIQRYQLNWDTHDDRTVKHPVHCLVAQTTTAAERTVQEEPA